MVKIKLHENDSLNRIKKIKDIITILPINNVRISIVVYILNKRKKEFLNFKIRDWD